MARGVVVATHNLMDGLRLPRLVDEHVRLHAKLGLDILCVQENRRVAGETCSHHIGGALGDGFVNIDSPAGRLAIIYASDRLELIADDVIELPRLDRLSPLERLYSGQIQRKLAQLATFACAPTRVPPRAAWPQFTVVNFHLDTAGANAHRQRQVRTIAAEIRARGVGGRVIACGDTNAFSMGRRRQLAELRAILGPLTELGATDPDHAPTHFFARQNEPKLPHRIGVALGRLGIDAPGRYDVVCTNLDAIARGQVMTPDSDHDLVWARIAP